MSGPGLAASGLMSDWVIPRGNNYFNAPIIMEDQEGVTWRGYGGQKPARLIYTGPPTKSFIQIVRSKRCLLKDFEIAIASPGVDRAIGVFNSPSPNPNNRASTANAFENIRILHAGYPTAAKYGFSVDSPALGGHAFNNEQHRFVRCFAQSYTESGFHFNGHQSHQNVLDGCAAHDHGGRSPIGVLCQNGSYFRWTNGTMTNNSIDFKLGSPEQQVVIENHSTEHSARFLVMAGVGGDAVITVRNLRWDGNPGDQPTIDLFGPNMISIQDSWLAGITGTCPTIRCLGANGSLDLSNSLIRQHLGVVPATPIITVPASWATRLFGVKHQRINENGSRTTSPIAVNTAQVV